MLAILVLSVKWKATLILLGLSLDSIQSKSNYPSVDMTYDRDLFYEIDVLIVSLSTFLNKHLSASASFYIHVQYQSFEGNQLDFMKLFK